MSDLRDRINALSPDDAVQMAERYGTHNYHPLPLNLVRVDGPYAYDKVGNQYIDCVGAYSAVAQGHLNEVVSDAMIEQLKIMGLVSRAVHTPELGYFLKTICEYTDLDMCCPMNTGAEAIETALKLARKWGYTVKGIPADKAEIIVATENFHGRTITIVGFSTEKQYQEGFGPFTPGFKVVPFGDIEAVRAAITPNTAAILMEPIQAEAGILFPPAGFMADLRAVCDENNVLLIWDEIQTGFGRTGKRFAWQHEDAKPDMMTLAKALGAGLYPVSAVVGRREVMEVFKPGDHGSTFGGNPIGAIVGIAAIEEMEREGLVDNSRAMGDRLKSEFLKFDDRVIEEVRGRGLLVGLEVHEGIDTKRLTAAFLENGVITKETRHRTFRFAPPLTVDESVVMEIVARVKRALDSVTATAGV
ncbi:MAG: ornithine--oxo-acid transaminase [Armatimonadetes bacterium]|nr:ornithine--oxo-acid transaminase [Armatimonadota bacterium]